MVGITEVGGRYGGWLGLTLYYQRQITKAVIRYATKHGLEHHCMPHDAPIWNLIGHDINSTPRETMRRLQIGVAYVDPYEGKDLALFILPIERTGQGKQEPLSGLEQRLSWAELTKLTEDGFEKKLYREIGKVWGALTQTQTGSGVL